MPLFFLNSLSYQLSDRDRLNVVPDALHDLGDRVLEGLQELGKWTVTLLFPAQGWKRIGLLNDGHGVLLLSDENELLLLVDNLHGLLYLLLSIVLL